MTTRLTRQQGRGARPPLGIALAALAASCVGAGSDLADERTGTVADAADVWQSTFEGLGRVPLAPPTEDVSVGDVFMFADQPAPADGQDSSALALAATPRWSALDVLPLRDDGVRGGADPPVIRADGTTPRRRTVDLRTVTGVTIDAKDLEPFLPLEVAALLDVQTSGRTYSIEVQVGEASTDSIPSDAILATLVDPAAGDGSGVLRAEHRRHLPMAANPATGLAYMSVVTEVLYAESVRVAILDRGSSPGDASPGVRDAGDPAVEALRRATALNDALERTGALDRIDGSIEMLAVADGSLSLERTWRRPLAIAVRGLTIEVDAATGQLLQAGPLGVPLPSVEIEEVVDEEKEESEVLEERRRGKNKEEEEPPSTRRGPRFDWDFGPRLDALRGDLTIVAGGRLHLDAAHFEEDDEIQEDFGPSDAGASVRRAFLELGGVYKQFDFNLWLNFANVMLLGEEETDFDNVDFRNVFVGIRDVPGVGSVRAGYFKEPFGLEETTSSNDISLMERSLTDSFIERRNLGVMAQRRFADDRSITAALGIYRNANNDLDVGEGFGVTGRLTAAPILSDDHRRTVHLGTSVTFRQTGDDRLRFYSRASSAQGQVLVDTGTFDAERELRMGFEFGAVRDSLSFQTETIVATSSSGSGVGDQVFWSTYAMGSYVLTGESRSYRERVGAFGSVHPESPFLGAGTGAFEAVGRYAILDLDSGDVEGGVLHDWTLGLNWYANDNLRVMLNYIVAHPESSGYEQIVQARLQLTL